MTMHVEVPSHILHDPLPGTEYRALRRIGAGASSEVWLAVGRDGVRRAVKVLRAVFADAPEAVFRLEQEGRALAALDHPSLVPVLEVGTTAARRPFLVMPLLEGQTARHRLRRRGPFLPASACTIIAEILEGLDVAHRAGVIHRDVKPANVFLLRRAPVGKARRSVLLDFGVAKMTSSIDGPTTSSMVVGTPRFLAPEQILSGAVDARTDVYAAGLTLFEMIAGRGPFDAEGAIEVMRAHLEATPRSLHSFASVSPELADAVTRAIAKEPARRFPSALAFAAELRRIAAREAVRSQQIDLDEEPSR
jgi:serine/threonine-protein kinase